MKKMISVPVGTTPSIKKYGYGGDEYIDYGYAPERLYPGTSLKSLINDLTRTLKEHRDRYQDMTFVEKRDCSCYHDCNCPPSYVLYGRRYETDLEYTFRLKQEAKTKADIEAREKEQYEKLKSKFETS